MSRALRRHPPAKQPKGARGKASARPLPRTGARAAPRGEGRSGLAAVASWRPRFVMDIINELRKVVWPSRQDTVHLTVVVVVVALLVGAALGGIDIGFGWLIDNLLLR
jgi:preprotein translocase SecE subunit